MVNLGWELYIKSYTDKLMSSSSISHQKDNRILQIRLIFRLISIFMLAIDRKTVNKFANTHFPTPTDFEVLFTTPSATFFFASVNHNFWKSRRCLATTQICNYISPQVKG